MLNLTKQKRKLHNKSNISITQFSEAGHPSLDPTFQKKGETTDA